MQESKIRPLAGYFLLVATVFAVMAAGCGSKNQTSDSSEKAAGPPVNGDWVVIHSLSDPENLNYLTSTDASSQEIDGYIYEGLTTVDPFTLERIPWIADSLPVVSPDHMSYEFKLKKNVVFSDGKPVTGEDFIFFLKTLKNPYIPQAPILAGYYISVDRAELVNNDPYRLRVVMNKPYFRGEVISGEMIAMPKHIWDPSGLSDKISFDELNKNDPNKNPAVQEFATFYSDVKKGMSKDFMIGSGPYKFEFWGRNDKVVLVRNTKYWNSENNLGKSYPDQLVWRTINDYNAALSSLKSGEIDVMPYITKTLFNQAKPQFARDHLKPVDYDYPTYLYIGYNEHNPLFADKAVRNALAKAIDRDAIIQKIYFGMARPVESGIFFKRPECDTTLPVIKFNLDEAKKMLSDAGWKDTDGDGILDKVIDGKKVDFRFKISLNHGSTTREQIALIFANALKKVGIDASVSSIDWALFLDRTRKGQYDAYIGAWATDVTEGDMYQIWSSKSTGGAGSNYVFYKNDRVDQIIDQIRQTFDQAKRKELYFEFQKLVYDDQPYNFLVSELYTGGVNDRFQNVKFFPPRPCYNPGLWWVPVTAQKYKTPKAVADAQ